METDNNTSLRVDSFSYYLDTAKDKSTTNPTKQPLSIKFSKPKETQDPTSAFTFSQAPKDGEIGVFNADKYFNMKLEYQTQEKSNERPVTPSLSSEASSWNSRSTFLPGGHHHKTESLTKQKTAIGRRIFTGFGCRGPCFDRKSVHTGSERRNELIIKVDEVDQSRPSIEVFGSSATSSKGDVATNMGRKLSMLTWDAIPKGKTLPTSTLGSNTICDDMASEASSDLFEIENISGSIYPLTSEPADDMSSCMSPTSVYAPSETSIQWSVVTASAADYSALLDCNDESVSVAGKMMSNRGPKMRNKEVKKSGPGGLLGCNSHKAVDVAENVCFKANEKVKNQG